MASLRPAVLHLALSAALAAALPAAAAEPGALQRLFDQMQRSAPAPAAPRSE